MRSDNDVAATQRPRQAVKPAHHRSEKPRQPQKTGAPYTTHPKHMTAAPSPMLQLEQDPSTSRQLRSQWRRCRLTTDQQNQDSHSRLVLPTQHTLNTWLPLRHRCCSSSRTQAPTGNSAASGGEAATTTLRKNEAATADWCSLHRTP